MKNEVLQEKFDETNLKLEGQNARMEEHKYEVITKLDAFQSGLGEQSRKMEIMEEQTEEMNTKLDAQNEKMEGFVQDLVTKFSELFVCKSILGTWLVFPTESPKNKGKCCLWLEDIHII